MGAVAPKEELGRLEKDYYCFPTLFKGIPHVNINVYLSFIAGNFLTSPYVFVKQNGVIGAVINLTLNCLETGRSVTLYFLQKNTRKEPNFFTSNSRQVQLVSQ